MSDDFNFDYSNSPLANPEFVRQATAQGQIAAALGDSGIRDTIVIANREGNEFAADGTFANDVMTLPYAELEARYGRQVAEQRGSLQQTIRQQRDAQSADRSNAQVVGDTALGVGAGFVGLVGSLESAVLQGAGAVDEYFDPENTGLGEFGVGVAETTNDVTGFIRSFQSDELQERRRLSGIENQLDGLDSAAQELRDLQAGDSEFFAGAKRIGRDVLNTGDRILSDGAVAGDIISEAIGSLGPSAKLAQGGARVAGATTGRITANETAQRVATTTGAALGVGVSEASGVLSEASTAVMQLSHDQLAAGSETYNAYLEAGLNPDQARMRVAVETGREAFARQLPAATALGLIAARFEANPVGAFQGSSLLSSLRQVGSQALEETGQGSIGKFNENIAVRDNADSSRQLSEGVGEAAATGLIAGAGMAGVLAAPGTGAQTARDVASVIGDAVGAREFNDPLTNEILGRESLGSRAVSTASGVVQPVVAAVRDRAEGADTAGRNEGAAAARETAIAAIDAVETGQASPELEAAVSEVDTTPAPEGVAGGSLIQNVTELAENLSNRSFKPTPAQTAYAASQFSRLRGMMRDMPATLRNQVNKMVNSPQARRIEAQARKTDLNATQSVDTEITTDVVAENVSVARVNPSNVNPKVVNKILKESGANLSDSDVRIMEGASSIASIVNAHTGRQVTISQERHIGLNRVGRSTDQAPLTQEGTSRSLRVEGFTDARGQQLRSINDFASEIFQGAQSADGLVTNQEGQSVPVQQVMQEFGNLVEHLNNKVGALNESFQNNNKKGRGPQTGFRGLVGGNRFIEADQFRNPVAYHRGNPNSAQFAKQVSNDLDAAVAVYNQIRNTFPELFGQTNVAESTELLVDEGGVLVEGDTTAIDETADTVEAPAEAVSEGEEQSQTEGETNDNNTDEVDGAADSEGSSVDTSETDSDATPSDEVSVDAETNVEADLVEGDADIQIDQSDDILKDEDGNPIKFYHGTNALFDTFNDGGIFLTTRKGLAREHARRGGEGTPRLIEANAKLGNPLTQQISNKEDPDAFWLKNSLKIEQLKAEGRYDSILIFNDNEGMVIADSDSQVIQTNKDFDNTITPEAREDANDITDEGARDIHQSFDETYQALDGAPVVDGLLDYVEKAEAAGVNSETISVAKRLAGPIIAQLNKRITDKMIKIDGKDISLVEALKDGEVQSFRQYRNTAIVDPTTGLYNQVMAEQAVIALVDWMMTATARDPSRLNEAMDDLGLTYDMVTDAQMDAIAFGLPPARVKDDIARDVMKMWNVRENLDAPLGELEGIAQGVVTEMLTALSAFTSTIDGTKENLIALEDVPISVDGKLVTTQTIVVRGLRDIQKKGKEANTDGAALTAKEALFGEIRDTYSVGQKINGVARTQSRGNVQLSTLEQSALKKMQDTPHFKDEGRVALFEAVGFEPLLQIFGYVDETEVNNQTLKNSIKGKNLNIIRNLEDADILVEQLEGDTPVYYPVGVTKVGRHQYQGVNPQSNKILRALVSPTWSDLTFSKEDQDAFWLGVAQAADLFKVEKLGHDQVLSEVQDTFNAEFREAVDLVKGWLTTGEIDGEAFARAVGTVEPQQIAAVHAVAEMEFAKSAGQERFRTSLSFELDGLTNGAANMMVNYGQGEITKADFGNLNRIGLFLGRVGITVNDFFKAGNQDLYETTSRASERALFNGLKNLEPSKRTAMLAAGRFAAHFGNFAMTDDGSFEMTRNTAKNPMTKVNYGSGVQGVGIGIADDMVLEFYRKIQNIPTGVNLDEYFGYPGVQNDIQALFGNTLPADLGAGAFEFPAQALEMFRKSVSDTIGTVLTESTKSVIGDKITEVNDMLVFSTNVQSQYLQIIFQQRLEELAEQRAEEGKIRRDKRTNKPILADLSRRDYQAVVNGLQSMSPIFVSDDQTLAIGGFAKKASELVLSSNMDGKLNQKANLPFPEDVGVKAIPFSVIGSGDAMMMNFIFGSEGAPNDVLGIFDGLDVPVGKVKEYAPYVNEQVLKTWERDVLAMAVQNFSGFLTQVGSDPALEQAFAEVMEKSKNTSVVASNSQELMTQLTERHRQNKARKAVLKRIPLSVDQMGGSDVGFSRGEGEMGLGAINFEIQRELDGRAQVEEDVSIEIQETTADAVLNNMRMSEGQKKVASILKPMMKDVRVVIGTISQLNAFRQENFPDDGLFLEGNAQFDAGNGTIFSTTTRAETLLHEMVHAGTYGRVLAHYNGETHDAVSRLEGLMNDFVALEITDRDFNEAKGAILEQLAQNDPASKAAAVNEFMAYSLTNAKIVSKLKTVPTTLRNMPAKVIQLMRRLMGGVPANMFDQVVFNTRVLNEPPIDNGGDGNGDNGDGGSDGENTPPAENYTNFWIDLIKGYIDDVKQDVTAGTSSGRALRKFSEDADAVIDQYRQAGMLSNNNARRTFKAIHMVMAAEMDMDSNSVIALTKVFQHIEANMTPDMFGSGSEAAQAYSAVINSFGNYKNGNVSDAVAVLLALSQTSAKFRAVLDQIQDPEGNDQVDGTLSSFLTQATSGLMRKVMGSIDTNDRAVLDTMDALADSLIQMDSAREYSVMQKVTASLDAADSFVSGKMSDLAEVTRAKNREVQEGTRSDLTKALFNTVTLGTNLLNKYSSEQTADAAKRATHMNVPVVSLVPIREFVSEVIGTDRTNAPVVALMDEVNSRISGMRQAYREDLPGILQNLFETHPTAEQWSSMHTVLGKTDFTRFVDQFAMQNSMAMLEDGGRRKKRIAELEQALAANYMPYIAKDAQDKAQQLADYMNGNGAGKLLARNAYAIAKNLDGNFNETMVEVIDELVTMYSLDQMDATVREETVQLWQNEPRAITGLITYIQGLNEAEDGKPGITEHAKLNGYKGFLPNHGDKNTRMIVDQDINENDLLKRGYTKLGPYTGDVDNGFPRSYYVTTTRQGGAYSQGVMQNVQSTYRGVDINTGLTVTGETSGFISDEGSVDHIARQLNDPHFALDNSKETLLPVFDDNGKVSGFERAINPDVYAQHMRQEENLAVMLGAWAGRHVEEMLADQYNRQLVDHLADIWSNREKGSDDLFVNLKKTSDPIYAEAYRLIPQGTKNYMDAKFDGEGVMVRKDMANLSVGYREASLADMWSGKTRLPQGVQEAVTKTAQFFMGKKAMKYLAAGEQAFQGVVSSAKDIIVIRSLVVPFANTKSNVIQLATRGVPVKQITKGFRSKLAEVEEYNRNVTKKIELEARLRLAARDANQRRIIQSQIQVIDDLNARMSIAPIVAAGAYKNLSEGITDLDVELSKGRIGDMVENLANKLPESVGNIAKVGLVSKSTKIYQVANRATQYGDFLAKSIYFDHLIVQGLSETDAISKMNEEFVNFSALPGRTRSYLETVGLTWFMAFKIRIAKIALQMLRENPVRALAINNALPDIGSPIQDNILSVTAEGRLDYATGFEMLFSAPELNPWVNLMSE